MSARPTARPGQTAGNEERPAAQTAARQRVAASRPASVFARHVLGLAALALASPLAGMAVALFLGPLDPLQLAALCGLVVVALFFPLSRIWRAARKVDVLAEQVATPGFSEQHARDPIARVDSAIAALHRRMAALETRGDPARRDDPTTGLPNRQTAMRRARDEISRARRVGHPLSVALLSIDIEPPGDDALLTGQHQRALRLTAELLMQGLRAYDVAARWDHNLFVALLPEAEVENAVGAIERIRGMAKAGWSVRRGETLPEIHGGVAVLQPDDATLAEIVSRAERALERARTGIGAAVQAAPGPRNRPVRLAPVE